MKSSKFNSANLKKIDAKKSKQEILSQFGIFFFIFYSVDVMQIGMTKLNLKGEAGMHTRKNFNFH